MMTKQRPTIEVRRAKDTVGCACLAGAVEGVCGAGYSLTLLCTMLEQNNNDQEQACNDHDDRERFVR